MHLIPDWGQYTAYGKCGVGCTQTRNKTCIGDTIAGPEHICQGNAQESRDCPCPSECHNVVNTVIKLYNKVVLEGIFHVETNIDIHLW